jgi:hypothetical protein
MKKLADAKTAEKMAAVSSFDPLNQAEIFACLADKGGTFEALDRAAIAGPIRIGWLLNAKDFALLSVPAGCSFRIHYSQQ